MKKGSNVSSVCIVCTTNPRLGMIPAASCPHHRNQQWSLGSNILHCTFGPITSFYAKFCIYRRRKLSSKRGRKKVRDTYLWGYLSSSDLQITPSSIIIIIQAAVIPKTRFKLEAGRRVKVPETPKYRVDGSPWEVGPPPPPSSVPYLCTAHVQHEGSKKKNSSSFFSLLPTT